jgi:AraC family transcriptional activator FtrA
VTSEPERNDGPYAAAAGAVPPSGNVEGWPHLVATVVVDGGNLFELSVAHEVFALDRPELGPRQYAHRLCTPPGGARLNGGGRLEGTHGFADGMAEAQTIVLPNDPTLGHPEPELLDAILAAHERGARLVSFCTGAFALAATGILDGRRATTHWMHVDAFRRRFPRVLLDPNVLFVDEGRVLTSAGTAAGIDLALHLVRQDLGAEAARTVARRMVVPPHRDGGQAQFVEPEHRPLVEADGMAALLDWLASNLASEVTVADMAQRAAMSERTFARRFKEVTGTTPLRWLLHQRCEKAQHLLESSDLAVDRIAVFCGFGTATNLRDHFRRRLGTTPSAYRRAFRERVPGRGAGLRVA